MLLVSLEEHRATCSANQQQFSVDPLQVRERSGNCTKLLIFSPEDLGWPSELWLGGFL